MGIIANTFSSRKKLVFRHSHPIPKSDAGGIFEWLARRVHTCSRSLSADCDASIFTKSDDGAWFVRKLGA